MYLYQVSIFSIHSFERDILTIDLETLYIALHKNHYQF